MAPVDIPKLAVGDRVQTELLVHERADRVTRDGVPFVVLTFGNKTGDITAPVWLKHEPEIRGVQKGHVVQVIGIVEQFRSRRQLRLTAPPRVVPAGGERIDEFLPKISESTDELWDEIDQVRAGLSGSLRSGVDAFFADEDFRSQFQNVPAGLTGRFARRGGLLLHTVEVVKIARLGSSLLGAPVHIAVAAAVLHDVGKVEFFISSLSGFSVSLRGSALGEAGLTLVSLDRMFRKVGIDVDDPDPEIAFVLRAASVMSDLSSSGDSQTHSATLLNVLLGADRISRLGGSSLLHEP